MARGDLKCRLDEAALDIVRLICASQLTFVWLRCARSPKRPAAFPIRHAASHRRSRTQDSAIGSEIRLDSLSRTRSGRRRDAQHRFQTFFAMRRKVSGRNGKRSAFPDYQERRPQTQNKKRKSHEKSKHTVQTSSKSSDPASPRLPWSSVYLGTHSGSSQRDRAVQRHSLGVR